MAYVEGVPYSSAQDLVNAGFGGYAGWGDNEALYDFRATGGSGKKTTPSSSSTSSTSTAASTGDLLKQQQAESENVRNEFLGRYTTAVEGLEPLNQMRERLITESFPQLPGVRESTQLLGQTIRELPEMIQNRATGYGGVTESNVQRKIAQEVGERTGEMQNILPSLEAMESRFGEQLGLEYENRMEALLPFETEASFIDEYLKGQVTLYNTQIAGQLSNDLQRIINEGLRNVQELKNVVELAKAENDYFSSSWVDSEGKKKLVNNRTGEVIAVLPGAAGGGGGGVTPVSNPPGTGQNKSLKELYDVGYVTGYG